MAITPKRKIPSGGVYEWLFGNDFAQIENDAAIEVVTPGKTHESITYGQLRTLVLQLASGLKRAGLKPGDRVLLAAPNCLLYTTVMLAVIKAEGSFLGASNSRTAEEFQHWMDTIEPSFVLVHHSIGDKFTAKSARGASFYFLDESSRSCEKTVQGPYGQVWPHWSKLLDTQVDLLAPIPQYTAEYLDSTPVIFTMTSGSTGKRKAAIQTHKSIAAAVDTLNIAYPPPKTPHRFITLSTMEPGHIGNTGELLMSLRHRQRLLISAIRDPPSVLELIRAHKVNGSFLGPLMINHLSHEATREDLASLKLVWTGGGTVPEPILAALLEKLSDDADMYFGYGSTEAGIGCRRHVRAPSVKHPAGYIDVGAYVPGSDMRVIDAIDGTPFHSSSTSDHDLPTRSGVLQLRSDANFFGYWQRPDATAEALTDDGWVDTGDLVILDERTRHVWIVGRKKDVLKVGGSQVLPTDIEHCIAENLKDSVEEVCVVGVPDPKYGEVPSAFIVPSRRNSVDLDNTTLSARSNASEDSETSRSNSLVQSVHDVVGAKLGPLSRLAGGVHVVTELPRLGIGKFDKMQLKERAKHLAMNGAEVAAA